MVTIFPLAISIPQK